MSTADRRFSCTRFWSVMIDDIVRGAAELGIPLEDVIAGVIAALQGDAERLGLAGEQKPGVP